MASPVIVSGHEQQVLPENAQVLGALRHIRHVVGRLKEQPLPVVDLHEENQQGPWGERARPLMGLLEGLAVVPGTDTDEK